MLQIRSDDGVVVALARDTLLRDLAASCGATERWRAAGFVPALEGGPANRNIVGFHDGLSIPRTAADVDEAVWLDGVDTGTGTVAGPAGATTMVVRQMPVDTAAFTALAVERQNEIVGRDRDTGAPLSGGVALDDPDIGAKDETGQVLIPLDAHVRRAHPCPRASTPSCCGAATRSPTRASTGSCSSPSSVTWIRSSGPSSGSTRAMP
ncbi:hypothetical protein GCM10025865_13340 [Paraoerskovia sediminicola]|uniref:Dyp-type peroxidase C-terminal domain-containing protein n=1 Tax=Paraoerskovia sediminicola TaxID=1138587 RepID=A0ABN6XBF0_9CELL|nr:Dyp-type peroxidase domain-containing protein [Paraoerskovia sediminicola]BDZ42035.1 hypothetical protein GCM10025865_13340 [Paraoerskovia sediminicola]